MKQTSRICVRESSGNTVRPQVVIVVVVVVVFVVVVVVGGIFAFG
jgi:hypothetical protein